MQAGDAIFIIDSGRHVAFANPSVQHITGYASEEVCGRNLAFERLHGVSEERIVGKRAEEVLPPGGGAGLRRRGPAYARLGCPGA